MIRLEREGIFKAKPVEWSVKRFEGKHSTAVAIKFVILGQLGDDGEWVSWAEADTHAVYGDFWVVKKDGTVNTRTVEDLAKCLGWDGDLGAVANGVPPDCVVQVNVKSEEYKGDTHYKVAWLNPEDYSPGPNGASNDEVRVVQAQFGSLLRAAAAAARKAAPGKAAPPKPAAKPPAPKVAAPAPVSAPAAQDEDDSGIPF